MSSLNIFQEHAFLKEKKSLATQNFRKLCLFACLFLISLEVSHCSMENKAVP